MHTDFIFHSLSTMWVQTTKWTHKNKGRSGNSMHNDIDDQLPLWFCTRFKLSYTIHVQLLTFGTKKHFFFVISGRLHFKYKPNSISGSSRFWESLSDNDLAMLWLFRQWISGILCSYFYCKSLKCPYLPSAKGTFLCFHCVS